MPKKKNDALTPRQRQSQQIIKQKASRKKRQAMVRRAQIYGGVCMVVLVFCLAGWLSISGVANRWSEHASRALYAATVKAGFGVRDIYLEGRSRTPLGEIEAALDIRRGDAILAVDLDASRRRLEAIASVRGAAVERALPGTLFVRIVEREPVALWQHGGRLALVDDQGAVMSGLDIDPYRHLPLLIGEGAPARAGDLLALLAAQPVLAKQFEAATWVGERRWNIRLTGGTEIKLPESDAAEAWKTVAELHAKQKLLDRAVKVVDMRIQGRLFMTISPPPAPSAKAEGAKEI